MTNGAKVAVWVVARIACGLFCGALATASIAACATAKPGRPQVVAEEPQAGVATVEVDAPHTEAPVAAEPAPTKAAEAAPTPAPPAPPAPSWIEMTPLIRVDRAARTVELKATAVLDVGFLEQYICLAGTRDHEALFVFEGKSSEVHAALLLAGFAQGAPGRWRELQTADGSFALEKIPPTGDRVSVTVEIAGDAPRPLDFFVRASPVAPAREGMRPPSDFVFAGSRFVRSTRTGVERYVADGSGSLIGLVTFGDETIAAFDVLPDQTSAAEPVWEVWTERMPKPGTAVTVTLRWLAPSAGAIAKPRKVRRMKKARSRPRPQTEPFRGQSW
ncbi:MAG: YdjY domain-containing protein [Planctomycetaceae bacterium]|nr:YdjY domain-containing protein [Planctomycetaceae bacterium]